MVVRDAAGKCVKVASCRASDLVPSVIGGVTGRAWLFLGLWLVGSLTGCLAIGAKYTMTDAVVTTGSSSEVEVFIGRMPKRPFVEIGTIEVFIDSWIRFFFFMDTFEDVGDIEGISENKQIPEDRMLKMVAKAKDVANRKGADGMYVLRSNTEYSEAHEGYTDRLVAVAFVYSD